MSIRIGVVGVGRIGKMHAEIIAHKIDNAELAGVFDVNDESASVVSRELHVPALSLESMLADRSIDAIAVCSSTDTHVSTIEMAAQAGKAIFCEKPISLDLDQVDRALAAIAEFKVPFMVGFNRRFDPSHAAVRRAVADGAVGDPHLARISSRDPAPPPIAYIQVSGGIFVDMMIHDFDMARFVVGSPVVEVYARGSVRIDPEFEAAGDLDTAVVMLTHADGTITTIDNSRQAVYGYDQRLEVLGSRGMAVSENPMKDTAVVYSADSKTSANLPYFFLERYMESYLNEWRAFTNYVGTGGDSPVSGSDGRAPVVIGLAAWESVRTRKPVSVSEG